MKIISLTLTIALIVTTFTFPTFAEKNFSSQTIQTQTQDTEYDELVGKYLVSQLGEFVIVKKNGKLFGGPAGQELEFIPVKNEKLKFEIYRNSSLFARVKFVKRGEKIILELLMQGFTRRGEKQTVNKFKKLKVLKNVTLIDGTGGSPIPNSSIFIQENKITKIAKGNADIPKDAKVIDLSGKFVIPGLIDAHTHVATDPSGSNTRPNTEAMLKHNLYGGVVAMRDMAGDARTLADLSRVANLDEIEAPNLYYSAVFAGPRFFNDRRTKASGKGVTPGDAPWLRGVTKDTNIPLAVAMAKGTGATGIKIYASLPAEEIKRIAEEARKQNMQVWAHFAIMPGLPLDNIDAGVNVVSHANMFVMQQIGGRPNKTQREQLMKGEFEIDEAVLNKIINKMVEKDVILDATLLVYSKNQRLNGVFKLAKEFVRKANKAGVPIAAGTDAFANPQTDKLPPIHEEIKLLTENGLSLLEAIKSATFVSAKAIGIEKTHGTIKEGKTANLVILNKNPTQDVSNLGSIQTVIKNGKFYNREKYAKEMKYKN